MHKDFNLFCATDKNCCEKIKELNNNKEILQKKDAGKTTDL